MFSSNWFVLLHPPPRKGKKKKKKRGTAAKICHAHDICVLQAGDLYFGFLATLKANSATGLLQLFSQRDFRIFSCLLLSFNAQIKWNLGLTGGLVTPTFYFYLHSVLWWFFIPHEKKKRWRALKLVFNQIGQGKWTNGRENLQIKMKLSPKKIKGRADLTS